MAELWGSTPPRRDLDDYLSMEDSLGKDVDRAIAARRRDAGDADLEGRLGEVLSDLETALARFEDDGVLKHLDADPRERVSLLIRHVAKAREHGLLPLQKDDLSAAAGDPMALEHTSDERDAAPANARAATAENTTLSGGRPRSTTSSLSTRPRTRTRRTSRALTASPTRCPRPRRRGDGSRPAARLRPSRRRRFPLRPTTAWS